MKPALRNQDRILLDRVDPPMFAIDPSGPVSGPVAA